MIVIDHELYGDRQEFETIEEAMESIERCEFKQPTELRIDSNGDIRDENGYHVGYEIDLASLQADLDNL